MQNKYIYILLLTLVAAACSTTRNLPDDEVLYTGIKEIKIVSPSGEDVTPELDEQIKGALNMAPNNALFGSSSVRIPLPFGLWIYNNFKTDKTKGLKHWIFSTFAADPVLISEVQPNIRSKAAETTLDDYGYFNANVHHLIVPDKKNPRKARISYFVYTGEPYRIASVKFVNASIPADSLIMSMQQSSLLKTGEIFNVNTLEAERLRISDSLRNSGYYYFRPDYITYQADSTNGNHSIDLRVIPKSDLPMPMLQPWRIGQIDFSLNNSSGKTPTDTTYYKGVGMFYRRRMKARRNILYENLAFRSGELYSQQSGFQTQTYLGRLNMFKYMDIKYTPHDSQNPSCDSLDVLVNATFDLPIDAELEFNVTTKSNDQTGPGAIFSITKRNIFKGGEVFNVEFKGSYEWQTGEGARTSTGGDIINSYELGVTTSLTYPRLLAPNFVPRDMRFAAATTFKLNADLLNRAGFFRLLTLGGSMGYDFYSTSTSTHSFTPFSLKYSYLLDKSTQFTEVIDNNRALKLSFQDQFIPSMSYTYTYDDASKRSLRNHVWFQGSVTEAGNIIYGAMDLLGNNQGNDKLIFGRKFSQFFKLRGEVRYYYEISKKNILAMRMIAGVAKPYLNSDEVPYSEQFFIGGANSVRAFAVRAIGPGSYRPQADAVYSYLDQTGTLKFEANVEYRFPIMDPLFGAIFLDAGNVWTIKNDTSRPGSQLRLNRFSRELALGTGAGLRLDISYLVLRFDVGVPLHAPYETSKTGYFNESRILKSLAYHIAIGYPF